MRKARSDCSVGKFEKKNGLPPGTVKKPKTPSPSIPKMIQYAGSAAAVVAIPIASSLIVSSIDNIVALCRKHHNDVHSAKIDIFKF